MGRGHRRRRSARRGRRWASAPPPAAALPQRWLMPQRAGLVRRLAAPRLPPQIEVPTERTLPVAQRLMMAAPSRAATPTRRRRSPQARRAFCEARGGHVARVRMDVSRKRGRVRNIRRNYRSTTRSCLQGVQITFSFLAGLHIEPIVPKLIRMGMPRGPLRRKLQEKIPQPQTLVA